MKRTARIRTDDRYQWPQASRDCQFPPKVHGMRSGRTLKRRRRLSNRNSDWSMLQGTHDASPRDLTRRAHTRTEWSGDLGGSKPSHSSRHHTPQGPPAAGPVSTTPGIGLSGRHIGSAGSFPSPCIRFLLDRCDVASIHEIRGASSPRNQGDPSPWCVSRETHHAKGAVLRYLPRSSSFAACPAPHLCNPGYPAARIRIHGDFTGLNLYIDITPYL